MAELTTEVLSADSLEVGRVMRSSVPGVLSGRVLVVVGGGPGGEGEAWGRGGGGGVMPGSPGCALVACVSVFPAAM